MATAVYLHIGEPKTGTTFLQQVLRDNRALLAEHGLHVAGASQYAVFRATQDLRELPRRADDPAPPWTGEWDALVADARTGAATGGGTAVISHELFSAATPAQTARAVAAFGDTPLHIVLSVRDIAGLLPAEWQESVKHRSTRRWDDWLADVIDVESVAPDRGQYWFWRVHDTAAILRAWEVAGVPRERLHVVTMPGSGAAPGLLWQRFAGVVGLSPEAAGLVESDSARRNASLGVPEMELLRRLNGALPEKLPNWYYIRHVKDGLAHGPLADRPGDSRLVLPPARLPWAQAYGAGLAAELGADGYDVVGDTAELVPVERATTSAARPEDADEAELFDAALDATTVLLRRRYRELSRQAAAPLSSRDLARAALRTASGALPGMGPGGRAEQRLRRAGERVRGVRRRVAARSAAR